MFPGRCLPNSCGNIHDSFFSKNRYHVRSLRFSICLCKFVFLVRFPRDLGHVQSFFYIPDQCDGREIPLCGRILVYFSVFHDFRRYFFGIETKKLEKCLFPRRKRNFDRYSNVFIESQKIKKKHSEILNIQNFMFEPKKHWCISSAEPSG